MSRVELQQDAKRLATEMKERGRRVQAYKSTDEEGSDASDDEYEKDNSGDDSDGHSAVGSVGDDMMECEGANGH